LAICLRIEGTKSAQGQKEKAIIDVSLPKEGQGPDPANDIHTPDLVC
jgi:hypothetical protein